MRIKPFTGFVAVMFVLLFSITAPAQQIDIETGTDVIKGHADAAPLGKVLTQVAEKAGFTIYLDEKLENTLTTFKIPKNLSPEKAIQHIIHPHSHAIVYGKDKDSQELSILELKVFSKGNKSNATYKRLMPGKKGISAEKAANKSSGAKSASNTSVSTGNSYEAAKRQTLKRKSMVRQDYYVKKSAFGASMIKARDRSKGPDYNPTMTGLKNSYADYKAAKIQEQQQMARARYIDARSNYDRRKSMHRHRRNQELKKYSETVNNN